MKKLWIILLFFPFRLYAVIPWGIDPGTQGAIDGAIGGEAIAIKPNLATLSSTAAMQAATAGMIKQIHQMEKQIYDYRTQVSDIIEKALDLTIITSDIIMQVKETEDLMKKIQFTASPTDIMFKVEMGSNLAMKVGEKITKMVVDIAELVKSPHEVLDTKKRLDMIEEIVNQLKELRGTFYMINRNLRTIVRFQVAPYTRPFEIDKTAIALQVVDEMKRDLERNKRKFNF